MVIPFVQRQPGDWIVATGDPFADQRSFAKSGRSGNQRQFTVQALVHALYQAGAGDDGRTGLGDVELGGAQLFQFLPRFLWLLENKEQQNVDPHLNNFIR